MLVWPVLLVACEACVIACFSVESSVHPFGSACCLWLREKRCALGGSAVHGVGVGALRLGRVALSAGRRVFGV